MKKYMAVTMLALVLSPALAAQQASPPPYKAEMQGPVERPSTGNFVGEPGISPELMTEGFLAAHPDLRWRREGLHAYTNKRYDEAMQYFLRAARYGDKKLFDRLHHDAKQATERAERARLLRALGGFTDPALVKEALAITLTNEFELRKAADLLRGGMADPRTRMITYDFTKQHFDEISAKLPAPFRPYMAYFAVGMCDDALAPDIKAFLEPRMKAVEGGEHALTQAMEQLSLCSAGRKAQAPAVAAFFAKQ